MNLTLFVRIPFEAVLPHPCVSHRPSTFQYMAVMQHLWMPGAVKLNRRRPNRALSLAACLWSAGGAAARRASASSHVLFIWSCTFSHEDVTSSSWMLHHLIPNSNVVLATCFRCLQVAKKNSYCRLEGNRFKENMDRNEIMISSYYGMFGLELLEMFLDSYLISSTLSKTMFLSFNVSLHICSMYLMSVSLSLSSVCLFFAFSEETY